MADPFASMAKVEKVEDDGFSDVMAQKTASEPTEEISERQDTAGGQEAEESKVADGDGDRKGSEARQEDFLPETKQES